jgi:hypothetical protein
MCKAEKSGVKNESIMRLYLFCLCPIVVPATNDSLWPVLAFAGRLT